jgi:VanZ family protein
VQGDPLKNNPFSYYSIIILRCLFITSLAATFTASVIRVDGPLPGGFSDKFWHGFTYFVLALLADRSFPASPFNARKFAPVFLYGTFIEFVQYLIPWRSFSVLDMIANASGIALYGILALLFSFFSDALRRNPH